MTKYFINPFAVNGDREAVPDAADPNGFVSYDVGYGFDYERDPDPNVDPLTKDIERDKMNQLWFDVTENIKFLQDTGGVPEWSSTKVGTNVGYPVDAKVMFNGVIYTSIAANNLSTPGSSSTWIIGGQTDATIRAIAALEPYAGSFIWFSGVDVAQLATITSFGRNLIGAPGDGQGRAILGIDDATTTNAGLVEWATDAEINNGTAGKAVDARQVRLGMVAVLSSNGGIRLPSWLWGITFNWGATTVSNDSNAFVSWPVPYANGGSVWQFFGNFGSSGNNQNSGLIFETTSSTQGRIYHNGSNQPRVVRWWSVGRSL